MGEMLESAHSKSWICAWMAAEVVSLGCWDHSTSGEQSLLSHTRDWGGAGFPKCVWVVLL